MAEVFVTFPDTVADAEGRTYLARACGAEMEGGRWQGWIEFEPTDGSDPLRSPRETTQPNRPDLAYWATGLTLVYLEGALERTLRPGPVTVKSPPVETAFDEPLPPTSEPGGRPEAVLNPYSVYRTGEAVLRRQLGALAGWHLVNIITAYDLSARPHAELSTLTDPELIELIVAAVAADS